MNKRRQVNLGLIFTSLFVFCVALYYTVPAYFGDTVYPLKYQEYIVKYSKMYDVDPTLVAAVILQESRFNPNAVSSAGAQGLMQFMPGTAATMAREVGRTSYDIYDPETSVQFGAAHIRDMLVKYNGDVDAALAAYNAGSGAADAWIREGLLRNIPSRETNSYVRKIKNYQSVYKSMYAKDLGVEPIKIEKTDKSSEIRGFVWSQIFSNFTGIFNKDSS